MQHDNTLRVGWGAPRRWAGPRASRLGPKGAPRRLGPGQDLVRCACASLRRGAPLYSVDVSEQIMASCSEMASCWSFATTTATTTNWSTLRVAPSIRTNCCSQLFSNSKIQGCKLLSWLVCLVKELPRQSFAGRGFVPLKGLVWRISCCLLSCVQNWHESATLKERLFS